MTDPMTSSTDGNETTSQWIQDYLLSRPVRRSFSCLWEQALYDPLTALMLPPLAKLFLLLGVFALVAILANTLSQDAQTALSGRRHSRKDEPGHGAAGRRLYVGFLYAICIAG